MIIKRWTGTTFQALYPKTTVANLYASDESTQLFDSNSKLKANYLPDLVFGGLRFVGTVTSIQSISELITGGSGTFSGYLDGVADLVWENGDYVNIGHRYIGHYWVATTTITIGEDVPAEIDAAMYDDGVYQDGVIEAGDWLVITDYDSGNNRFKFGVINNTYSSATASTAGVVKLGSATVQSEAANTVTATSNRTYAVQTNSTGGLVVNVPWAGSVYNAGEGLTLDSNTFRETNPLYVQSDAPTTSVSGAIWFDL